MNDFSNEFVFVWGLVGAIIIFATLIFVTKSIEKTIRKAYHRGFVLGSIEAIKISKMAVKDAITRDLKEGGLKDDDLKTTSVMKRVDEAYFSLEEQTAKELKLLKGELNE